MKHSCRITNLQRNWIKRDTDIWTLPKSVVTCIIEHFDEKILKYKKNIELEFKWVAGFQNVIIGRSYTYISMMRWWVGETLFQLSSTNADKTIQRH